MVTYTRHERRDCGGCFAIESSLCGGSGVLGMMIQTCRTTKSHGLSIEIRCLLILITCFINQLYVFLFPLNNKTHTVIQFISILTAANSQAAAASYCEAVGSVKSYLRTKWLEEEPSRSPPLEY